MRRPRRHRSLTPEEAELWRAVMKDAEPLPPRRARKASRDVPPGESTPEPEPPPPPPIPPIPRPAPKGRPAAAPPPPPPAAAASRPHALNHGDTIGIDRRTAGRFVRGRMEIDGRLDLHGMTQESAHRALCAFLARAHDHGHRCVIVVTGKGSRGEGGGVLRRKVPQWLNDPGLRQRILSFVHAQPQHGGEGALYVLLKRHRPS